MYENEILVFGAQAAQGSISVINPLIWLTKECILQKKYLSDKTELGRV